MRSVHSRGGHSGITSLDKHVQHQSARRLGAPRMLVHALLDQTRDIIVAQK